MTTKKGLLQFFRKPKIAVPYLLLTCLLTAFLCIGFVLLRSGTELAEQSENAYDTIGVAEFFKDVPEDREYYHLQAALDSGRMTEQEYQINYDPTADPASGLHPYPLENGKLRYTGRTFPCGVQRSGFALDAIAQSPYVTLAENRARYGAYINYLKSDADHASPCVRNDDVLIFTPLISEKMTMPAMEHGETVTLPVQIHYSLQANLRGFSAIYDQTSLSVNFFPQDSRYPIVLEPGKTYITFCNYTWGAEYIGKRDIIVTIPHAKVDYYLLYDVNTQADCSVPAIANDRTVFAEYYDGFLETEQGARIKAMIEAMSMTHQSATVMTTQDLRLFMPFHHGSLSVREGRAFSAAEYREGAQVCLVSYVLALRNGWSVGDEITMGLYPCDSFSAYNQTLNGMGTRNFEPVFVAGQSEVFSEQTYRIIGLYDGSNLNDMSKVVILEEGEREPAADGIAQSRFMVSETVIFVPQASVRNAPADAPASFLTTSFRLKNGTTDLFLEEMRQKGVLGPSADGYTTEFTFYDQGYYRAAGLLQSTRQTARLLVGVSLAAATETVLLFAYLYVARRRREISVMRSLGLGRGRIAAEMLLALLLVTGVGTLLGCGLAFAALGAVERAVLSAPGDRISAAFSGLYGQDIDKTALFSLSRAPELFLAAFGIMLALTAVITVAFLLATLSQSPMKLLSGRRE